MKKPAKKSFFAVLGSLRTQRSTPSTKLPPIARRMFLLAFLSEFIVIYPFYVIMFGDRGDVSAAGVGTLLAVWLVVSVLSEVPTGIIADKISKKWSLVLGRILQLATFTIWLLAPNFTGYLLGFVVWGVGEAFLSGAFQAYLYESLDDDNKKIFGKIYSRTSAFTMMAYMAGGLLAFVIGPDYAILLLVSMLVSAVSLVLTFGLPDTRSQVDVELRPKILASAIQAIRTHPKLRHIVVGAVILYGLMNMLGEYMPAYYHQVGVSLDSVPLLMSIGSGAAALLYWWMHRIERQLTRYQMPILVVSVVLFGATFWGGPLVAVVGLFLFTRLLRMLTVHNEAAIQHHAPNESRATVASLYSFAGRLLSAGIIALVGIFAVHDQIVTPIRWSIFITIVVFALIVYIFRPIKTLQATPQSTP